MDGVWIGRHGGCIKPAGERGVTGFTIGPEEPVEGSPMRDASPDPAKG